MSDTWIIYISAETNHSVEELFETETLTDLIHSNLS